MKTIEIPEQYADDNDISVNAALMGRDDEGRMICAYVVYYAGQPVLKGIDLSSGCWDNPTEEDMVRSLCSFLSAAGESFNHSGDESEYVREYTADERAFLEAHGERFGMAFIEEEN